MTPRAIVETLGMIPHPEGGWYVETHRDLDPMVGRGACTAIYFLLEAGQRSAWHKVDATEIWLWHAGAPLALVVAREGGRPAPTSLGPDLAQGQRPQAVVPPDAWQTAWSEGSYSLVSCVVSPAFRFEGFTLAPAGWSPG